MGALCSARAPQHLATAFQDKSDLSRREPRTAPQERTDHVPHGAPTQDASRCEGPTAGEGKNAGMASRERMAIPGYQVWSPTLGALPVDSARAPVSTHALNQAIPLLATPYMVNLSRQQSLQGVYRQSDSIPTRVIRKDRGLQHGLEHVRETVRMLGTTLDRCSAAQRQPPPTPGSRAHPEID